MSPKKLATWLLVIGMIALIAGAVIGSLTFDVAELKGQIAEKKASFYNKTAWAECEDDDVECLAETKAAYNKTGNFSDEGCDRSGKKGMWFWKMMLDD